MENHLAQLAKLLSTGVDANINQRYHDAVGNPNSSSSSNRFPFKMEAKVEIPNFEGEVDAKRVNN